MQTLKTNGGDKPWILIPIKPKVISIKLQASASAANDPSEPASKKVRLPAASTFGD